MNTFSSDLESCELCEWRCRTNRLEGERGVCLQGLPKVSSAMLHPAPPKSYTVFMAGCNFRCLNCQNWDIANYPVTSTDIRGLVEPERLAKEISYKLKSKKAKILGADRVFFSGGSPTPSLPYIEKVIEEAKKITSLKVNYDTNGFLTRGSLKRVLKITDSITFDIKAYNEEVHRALTGAPVAPVLDNAEYLIKNAPGKLWEFRYLLIPGMNEDDVPKLARFLARIDPSIPLNILAFRPNFVLEDYLGASHQIVTKVVNQAKREGLKKVSWSGRSDLPGRTFSAKNTSYKNTGAMMAGELARNKGCITHPRECGHCDLMADCPIKSYIPTRRT